MNDDDWVHVMHVSEDKGYNNSPMEEGDFIYMEEIPDHPQLGDFLMKEGDYLLVGGIKIMETMQMRHLGYRVRGFFISEHIFSNVKYKVIRKDDTVEYAKALLLWRDE